MNGLLFGIFSRKKFQIPITLKKIYSFILLKIEINPQQLDFSSGAFLYRLIAVLRISQQVCCCIHSEDLQDHTKHDQRSAFILMKGHCCNFNIFILFSVLFYLFFINVNEMFEYK